MRLVCAGTHAWNDGTMSWLASSPGNRHIGPAARSQRTEQPAGWSSSLSVSLTALCWGPTHCALITFGRFVRGPILNVDLGSAVPASNLCDRAFNNWMLVGCWLDGCLLGAADNN